MQEIVTLFVRIVDDVPMSSMELPSHRRLCAPVYSEQLVSVDRLISFIKKVDISKFLWRGDVDLEAINVDKFAGDDWNDVLYSLVH